MNFETMDELKIWLSLNKKYNIDGGSQGECYKIGNMVYKIFLQFIIDEDDDDYFIEYNKDDILKFSSIKNNTYVWPIDVITVGDIIVGYIMNFVNAKLLCKTNPLLLHLNKFEKSMDKIVTDIKIISNNGILSYDVCYNVMYGRDGFKIIDTLEYSHSYDDMKKVYVKNMNNFSYEVKMFLVDGFFDNVVNDSKLLSEMYNDLNVTAIEFLRIFRNRLCEIEGIEVLKLGDAKKSLCRQRTKPKYIRNLY